MGTGDELSQHCSNRACVLVASEGKQEDVDDFSRNLVAVQTYLLLKIAAMAYLKPEVLAYAGAEDLNSLWKPFVTA